MTDEFEPTFPEEGADETPEAPEPMTPAWLDQVLAAAGQPSLEEQHKATMAEAQRELKATTINEEPPDDPLISLPSPNGGDPLVIRRSQLQGSKIGAWIESGVAWAAQEAALKAAKAEEEELRLNGEEPDAPVDFDELPNEDFGILAAIGAGRSDSVVGKNLSSAGRVALARMKRLRAAE